MNDLFASLSTKETLDFYQFSIKRSHSIHMLSIQIDTKSFELVQQHQIVLLCKLYIVVLLSNTDICETQY